MKNTPSNQLYHRFLVGAILFITGCLTSSSALAEANAYQPISSQSMTASQTSRVQTPSCSAYTSDRFCRDRTAGSRCQGLHGVGICSIDLNVPNDPYGLPACQCL